MQQITFNCFKTLPKRFFCGAVFFVAFIVLLRGDGCEAHLNLYLNLQEVMRLLEKGALSIDHPNNPRVLKERERDRGLRIPNKLVIETFTNFCLSSDYNMNGSETATIVSSTANVNNCVESDQSPSEFPKDIPYFSGNPNVEVIKGIIHLYKKNECKDFDEAPSNQICLLAVPATLDCHDLLSFVAPCHSVIQHIRIVRDSSPNQFMVLLEFCTNESAFEFYQTYNGCAYNSLEPELLCHAVWVSGIERGDDGVPPLGHTELPTCPVCLERMDESVDGVLTILCNHVFHANCLIKWCDSTCPVCRHVQTPELMENSVCMECEGIDSLWICLICGHVGCGRYQGGHAAAHYRATNHTYALQLGTSSVWDYAGDNFVHRLFQNKTDGKLIAGQTSHDEGEEKIDSMQLEFTYLLTSQLDIQRKFYEDRLAKVEREWHEFKKISERAAENVSALDQKLTNVTKEKQGVERKLAQNNKKLKEVQNKLSDEKEICKAMQNNENSWQNKYIVLEKQFKEFKELQEFELKTVREELRDLMFYVSAQSQIEKSKLKDEIKDGTIIVTEKEQKASTSKNTRRHKK